jgi:hypothetical protein
LYRLRASNPDEIPGYGLTFHTSGDVGLTLETDSAASAFPAEAPNSQATELPADAVIAKIASTKIARRYLMDAAITPSLWGLMSCRREISVIFQKVKQKMDESWHIRSNI